MQLVRKATHQLVALVWRERLGKLVLCLSRHEAEVAGGTVSFGRGQHGVMQLIGMKLWLCQID